MDTNGIYWHIIGDNSAYYHETTLFEACVLKYCWIEALSDRVDPIKSDLSCVAISGGYNRIQHDLVLSWKILLFIDPYPIIWMKQSLQLIRLPIHHFAAMYAHPGYTLILTDSEAVDALSSQSYTRQFLTNNGRSAGGLRDLVARISELCTRWGRIPIQSHPNHKKTQHTV